MQNLVIVIGHYHLTEGNQQIAFNTLVANLQCIKQFQDALCFVSVKQTVLSF